MPWNYRIMRHLSSTDASNDEPFYAIHEVYYGDGGVISNWTQEPCGCSGETLSELSRDIAWYMTALVKPVLDHATGQQVEPAQMLEDDIYAMIEPGSEMARKAIREHGSGAVAQAIEARRAATLGAVHESAAPIGDAPKDAPDA